MTWNEAELERIGRAEELDLASRSDDGSLSPYVTIWGILGSEGGRGSLMTSEVTASVA